MSWLLSDGRVVAATDNKELTTVAETCAFCGLHRRATFLTRPVLLGRSAHEPGRSRVVASLSGVRSYPLTHEQRLRKAAAARAGRSGSRAKLTCGIGHGLQLPRFGLRRLGYHGQPAGRAISSADDDRSAGTMAHRRCAVVRRGPRNPERFLSADRSEPLEVVADPIDDRDPIEANPLLP